MRCFSAATDIPAMAIEMISVAETLKHRNKDIEFPLKNVKEHENRQSINLTLRT
jgi:hypothetical protein